MHYIRSYMPYRKYLTASYKKLVYVICWIVLLSKFMEVNSVRPVLWTSRSTETLFQRSAFEECIFSAELSLLLLEISSADRTWKTLQLSRWYAVVDDLLFWQITFKLERINPLNQSVMSRFIEISYAGDVNWRLNPYLFFYQDPSFAHYCYNRCKSSEMHFAPLSSASLFQYFCYVVIFWVCDRRPTLVQ